MLSITPDTWSFFYCAFEHSVRTFVQRSVRTFVQRSVRTFVQRSVRTFVQRSVRTLRISISIAVRKVVDQTQRNNVPARSFLIGCFYSIFGLSHSAIRSSIFGSNYSSFTSIMFNSFASLQR